MAEPRRPRSKGAPFRAQTAPVRDRSGSAKDRAQAAPVRDPRGSANKHGFTLIEMLVAVAVFSLAAMALLNLAGENTRTATWAETRALAAIVAENRAVEVLIDPAAPAPGQDDGVETLAGRDWAWTRTVSATAQPDIVRIDVSVSEGGAAAAALTVFRGV